MKRLAILCLCLTAACSSKSKERAPATGSGSGSALGSGSGGGSGSAHAADAWGSGSSSIALPPPAKLTLDAPGAEPRRTLPAPITAVDRVVVFTASSWIGDPSKATIADLRMAWSCVATGPCRYQLQKFEVRGGPPEPAFETVAKSTRGVVTIEADGKVLIQPETFMKTMPSTVELLRMAIVRYPTAPIGVGATWTEQESDLRRVYKVTKLDDTTIELDVTFTYESEAGVAVPGTSKLAARLGDPLAQTLTSTQQQTFPMNGTPVETRTELTLAPAP